MRIFRVYFRFFWPTLLLVVIGVVGWFFIPDSFSTFKSTLFGTLLGVGITLVMVEGYKKLHEYRRINRIFGLLKLTTIPYLKSQSESFQTTMKQFNDICSIEQAIVFFVNCGHLDRTVKSFDKSWLQLIYSQDFLDAVSKDDHFNRMAHAIFEVLLFLDQLSTQSVNAQINLLNDATKLPEDKQKDFIERARRMRDELEHATSKLLKYTSKLDEEIIRFFDTTGIKYSEFDR